MGMTFSAKALEGRSSVCEPLLLVARNMQFSKEFYNCKGLSSANTQNKLAGRPRQGIR